MSKKDVWHFLDVPEYWDEGPQLKNENCVPKKEGFYMVAVKKDKNVRHNKIVCCAYFTNEKGRGHFWDLDTNRCGMSEYAVLAWADVIPFPEVPDGKATSA